MYGTEHMAKSVSSRDPRGRGSTMEAKRRELKKKKSIQWTRTLENQEMYMYIFLSLTLVLSGLKAILPIIIMYGTFLNGQLPKPRQTSVLGANQRCSSAATQRGREAKREQGASPKQREKSPSGCTGM